MAINLRYSDGLLATLIFATLVPPLPFRTKESVAKLRWVRNLEAWLEGRND